MAETIVERNLRDAMVYLDRAMRFLVTEFGYADIGRVPVTTADVVVRGYRNTQAGVQVEVSGHPPGETFVGGLRRLQNGEPLPYDRDHFLSITNLALVRKGRHDDRLDHNSHPRGWKGVVDTAVELLKDNRLLLTGEDWIPGARVTAAWDRHFQREFGFTPDPNVDESWPLNAFKANFAFLLERGYRLVFDATTLTPHEYLVTRELRYESGSDTVRIHRADPRDGGNWAVSRGGRDLTGYFHPTDEEIKSVAGRIEAELR